MHNYYGSRLIKVISPSTNEVFSLELDGDEKELKELLATLINIPVCTIKGLRDPFGNYFTISSAIQNPNIALNQNIFFSVVINTKSILNENYSREDSGRNKINSKIYQSENTNYMANYSGNLPNQKGGIGAEQINPLFNIENISPIRKLNKLPSNSSISSRANSIDKYHQIALQMISQKIIEEKDYQILKNKLQEENEEVISVFKQYFRNGCNIEKLKVALLPFLNFPLKSYRDSVHLRSTYGNIINSLSNHFNNPNDVKLLNQLLQCDNDMIIKALEAYEFSNDQQKLINTLQSIVKKYRGRFSDSQNVESSDNNNIQNINFITSILDLKVVDSPGEQKATESDNNNKQSILNEIVHSIEEKLRFDLSALFLYDLENKSHEKLIEEELKIDTNQKDNIPYESVKYYYKNYLQENITSDYSSKETELYKDLVKSKDNKLVDIFFKFRQYKNIETLSNKIQMYLNKVEEEREKELDSYNEDNEEEDEEEDEGEGEGEEEESEINSDSESFDTSSSNEQGTDEDERNDKLKANNKKISNSQINNKGTNSQTQGTAARGNNIRKTNSSPKESSDDIDNKKAADFIKVVNKLALGDDVKKEIFQLFSNKNDKMMKVYENFQKNRMSLTKNVLLQVIKQSSIKANPTKDNPNYSTKQSNSSKQPKQEQKQDSFEECAKEFLNNNSISKKEYNFLLKRFESNDELLYSFWEIYLDDQCKKELYESIKMYFDKGSIQKQFESYQENESKIPACSSNTNTESKGIQGKLEDIFKQHSFSEAEKQLLRGQLKKDNQMLLSIMESYTTQEDAEEAIESLNMLLFKLNNR